MDGWFTGKFEYSIDTKGRISVPAKFRDILGENTRFHTIRVPKYRIRIYPEDEWEKKARQYENLPETEIFDGYRRDFYNSQADSEMDGQGRITINAAQLKQIKYKGKKLVMLGMGKYIEMFCAENEFLQADFNFDDEERAFAQNYYKVHDAMREFEKK